MNYPAGWFCTFSACSQDSPMLSFAKRRRI